MMSVFLIAVVLIGLLWLNQRALIYFPESDVPPPGAVGLPQAEPVSFETEDGLRLEGWFVPAGPLASGGTVIVFNGNSGNRASRAELAAQLAARGLAVLLFDYRGYGGNPGLPSEEGLRRDARAALACAGRQVGVDPARLIFFGESLGAAVAVRLALDYPPAALVLRSPFPSLASISQHHYPFLPARWLLRDRYRAIEQVGTLASPVLVIAGSEDRTVPPAESEELYDAAPHPKRLVVVEDAGHDDERLASGPQVIRAILDFVSPYACQR